MKASRNRWLLAGAIVLGALFLSSKASASEGPPPQGGGYAQISQLAGVVEQRAGLAGFRAFALAVAQRESKGNNLAVNDSPGEAKAACNLYEGNWRFVNNPFPPDRFCFGSGGWYGFLPATGLAGEFFRNSDPYLIFDPQASTAMLADYVFRVAKGYWWQIPAEHRNLLTIRRFMASNAVGLDWDESGETSRRIRDSFGRELEQRGFNRSVMFTRVSIADYPGTAAVYGWLTGIGLADEEEPTT